MPVNDAYCVIDLEVDKLMKVKVNCTICAVAKWKECAELFSTADNIHKAKEMLVELDTIMEGLGAKITRTKCVESTGM